jgi:two-component system, OmpR family, KDP operon response regulator KdpE
MKKHILVVDDDRQITRMLRTSLQANGYQVSLAQNGLEAFDLFQSGDPNLIITDIAMPEMNGVELTQVVRRISETPIIVLSVRDTDQMKVTALDEGADDYVTKPFRISELLARVRAQLRRQQKADNALPARIELGDFVIAVDLHQVTLRGEEIHLTPKEFDLLLLFARNPLRILTHKTLLQGVWGPAGEDQPEYLRVLIAQLRKKIERGNGPQYIQSEPWVGYRFHPTGKNELTTS